MPGRRYFLTPIVGTWVGTCVFTEGQTLGSCSGAPTMHCADTADCGLSIDSMTSDWLCEDNVYDRNTIEYSPENKLGYGFLADQGFGIVVVGSVRCEIADNVIENANAAIHFGAAAHDKMMLAGTCTGRAGRWCQTDADCDIPGIDDAEPGGTCDGTRMFVQDGQNDANIGAKAIEVRGNLLVGNDLGLDITRGSQDIHVVGNDVSGGNTAIVIRQNAIETTVVTRNQIHDGRFGFVLDKGVGVRPFSLGKTYGSVIALNDVTGQARTAVTNGVCSNFLLSLSCTDASDCDNACLAAIGACRRTGKPCAGNDDCRGTNGPAATGTCNLTTGTCTSDSARTCSKAADCAVTCRTAFELAAELSDEAGRGNYWGHTCDEGGFLASDTRNAALLVDSHPYGVPVAALDDASLPPTCR